MAGKRSINSRVARLGVLGLAQGGAQEAHITAHMGVRSEKPTERGQSDLERDLERSLLLRGCPAPEREFRFHPVRKWRLDLAWPTLKLGVEIEGGIYRGGGHTSVAGLKRDMAKSNALALMGWRLLRFHGDQVRSGEAAALIEQALAAPEEEA